MKCLLAILVLTVAGCSAQGDVTTESEITTEGDVTTNSIGMKLKLIPAGTFMMGSEEGYEAEKPIHQVTLTQPFLLGIYEVTQEQYERVMGVNLSQQQYKRVMGVNPSSLQGAQKPVKSISWERAVQFCQKLSELPKEKAAGHVYRLPTEAEWEYACRAGTTTKFSFGDDESQLGEYAWFDDNSGRETHPVGEKKPNAWGLYDMHGNVWEWCSDRYGDYPSNAVTDPTGASTGSFRVYRGGSWFYAAEDCRSARSDRLGPSNRNFDLGLRVACVPSGQQAEPQQAK